MFEKKKTKNALATIITPEHLTISEMFLDKVRGMIDNRDGKNIKKYQMGEGLWDDTDESLEIVTGKQTLTLRIHTPK